MDYLSSAERKLLEASELPLAVYDYVDGKVVTVLVSDGLCKMKHMERDELVLRFTDSMFNLVHPDDAGKLARLGDAFAKKEAGYDVLYRTRSTIDSDYYICHTTAYWQKVASGHELAFFFYTNVSRSEKEIRRLSDEYLANQKDLFYIDPITGIPNSNYLHEFFDEKVHDIRMSGESPVVIYVDVIGMQAYNIQFGYEEGDELLKLTAASLQQEFPGALITRSEADHFVLVTADREIEVKIYKALLRVRSNAKGTTLGFQAGICRMEEEMAGFQAVDHAKHALRSISDDYNQLFSYYSASTDNQYWEQRYIVENFDRALIEKHIQIHYQGMMRIRTGKMAALEALARWNDPIYGTLSPARFIPMLEKYHLLHKLDLYMVEQVCREIPMREKDQLKILPVTVNFSGQDFDQPDIVDKVITLVDRYGIEHNKIIIEITEQAIPKASAQFRDQIEHFRDNGFSVWVDDFGSGYSSLNVFSRYSFDLVKLDMDLLRSIDDDGGVNRLIISSIVSTMHKIGLLTLAEWVETKEQLEFLRSVDCDLAQGFYLHRPESLGAIEFKNKNQGGRFLDETDEEALKYGVL